MRIRWPISLGIPHIYVYIYICIYKYKSIYIYVYIDQRARVSLKAWTQRSAPKPAWALLPEPRVPGPPRNSSEEYGGGGPRAVLPRSRIPNYQPGTHPATRIPNYQPGTQVSKDIKPNVSSLGLPPPPPSHAYP